MLKISRRLVLYGYTVFCDCVDLILRRQAVGGYCFFYFSRSKQKSVCFLRFA
nr:MAG TPA: hypothetical protein [Caudoviricetes sp.]